MHLLYFSNVLYDDIYPCIKTIRLGLPFVFEFVVYQALYDPQIVELGKAYLSYLQGDEFLQGLSVLAIGIMILIRFSSVLIPRIEIGVIMGILLCHMNTYLTKTYPMISGL